MNPSTVTDVVDVPPYPMGPGFQVAGVRHEHLGRALDPVEAEAARGTGWK